VTSEGDIVYFSFSTLASNDHLSDVGKMILNDQFRFFASNFGLINDFIKIFPLIITKQLLQIPSAPKFKPVFCFLSIAVKAFMELLNDFLFHHP